MHYLRLLTIIFVIFIFGLDEFIANHFKFKPLHILLKCIFFWRNTEAPRGVRLRLALEKLGPLFVKFGQMLSTRRDLLPADVAEELAKLQDKVPPFAFADVQKSIEAAFGLPLNLVTQAILACIRKFGRSLQGTEEGFVGVTLQGPRPHNAEQFEQFFGVPVTFE